MYREIQSCRICEGRNLEMVLDLGKQHLTGVFPKDPEARLTCGPLVLARCHECGLVQLMHSYEPLEIYGKSYGYRSGLNGLMTQHLRTKSESLQRLVNLRAGDVVVDIGSNDGTLLGFYPPGELRLVGFDPSAEKFKKFYRPDISLVVDFFSAKKFRHYFSGAKARLVTSIAMFYDLEKPLEFMREVAGILAEDGVWHFEQSYLPTMLSMNAYDTICHEHLEYYAMRQIKWMADRSGLKIIDLQINDVNGGSFAVTAARADAPFREASADIVRLLKEEEALGLGSGGVYADFKARVFSHREQLLAELEGWRKRGKKVLGYGASTKGNVILQFCGITPSILPCIAEVNADKFGAFTPGTKIPIVSEEQAHALAPDCFMVMPWHFRKGLIQREAAYLKRGGKLLFPLPKLEIVGE